MAKAATKKKPTGTIDPSVMLPVRAWSPSALSAYEGCPRRYQYDRLMHLCVFCFAGRAFRPKGSPEGTPAVCNNPACAKQQPEAEPLVKGTRIHKEAELYIKGLGTLTPDLKKVKKVLAGLRKGYKEKRTRVELELAYRRDWTMTTWFGSDAYARFKLDVLEIVDGGKLAEVTDWKTGKPHPQEYEDALAAYAVGALSAGFGETTRARLVYTLDGAVIDLPVGTAKRADLPKLQKKWDARAKKMFVDKIFAPRPGNCKYCPFTANCGGPCEY